MPSLPTTLTTLTALLLLPLLTLSHPLTSHASVPLATYTLTNFTLFIASPRNTTHASSSAPKSGVSFHLSDTRPSHALEIECVLQAEDVYKELFTMCGGANARFDERRDASFQLSPGTVVVQRGWDVGAGLGYMSTYAPQGTYWKEGVNMTRTAAGTFYSRAEPWAFPVQSASM